MVTITDVCRRAGVSRSTVSRVVAGNGYVSESKRKAIEEAIAELGYRPNTLAQASLARSSSISVRHTSPT
jgi:LacI family transcriptional regulator